MRFWPLLEKSTIENLRDWKILILILTLAPFFVVLMYFYFGDAAVTYRVVFLNHDEGATTADGATWNGGDFLISELKKVQYPDGKNVLKIDRGEDMAAARRRLMDRSADLIVEIPEGFTRVLLEYKAGKKPAPVVVKTIGDPANVKYIMAAAWCDSIAAKYAAEMTGQKGPLELETEGVSPMKSLNDFDLYVPALLALSMMGLMFTAAATLIREKDKGTLVRLRISNMTAFEWLSAVSLTQVVIGLLALGLTLLTAVAMGYETSGSLLAFAAVGLLSSLAIIAISLIVAAFLRTIFDLMTVGCFPYFLLLFFSGGMFPLPSLQLFALAGRPIHVNDILPTTHSISALGKILNSGARIEDVLFEMTAIAVLTILYFAAGVWLFARRHLRAR